MQKSCCSTKDELKRRKDIARKLYDEYYADEAEPEDFASKKKRKRQKSNAKG